MISNYRHLFIARAPVVRFDVRREHRSHPIHNINVYVDYFDANEHISIRVNFFAPLLSLRDMCVCVCLVVCPLCCCVHYALGIIAQSIVVLLILCVQSFDSHLWFLIRRTGWMNRGATQPLHIHYICAVGCVDTDKLLDSRIRPTAPNE